MHITLRTRAARRADRPTTSPDPLDQPPPGFDPEALPILSVHWFGITPPCSEFGEKDRAA